MINAEIETKPRKEREPSVSLRAINTIFGDQVIHKDLILDFYYGQAVVLMGASGCGKTTLMRGMVGLETAVTGSCLFEGQNLLTLSDQEWLPFRQKIAFAFQQGALFDSLSVFENCAFPLREHPEVSEEMVQARVDHLLKEFDLQDARDKLPKDISGGMQKRVGLTRALVVEPQLLLLDEPTAGLDPTNTKKVVEIVRQYVARGATVLIVTHDREAAFAMGDRLVLFGDGGIVADMKVDEVGTVSSNKIQEFLCREGAH